MKKNPESAVELVDLGVVEVDGVEQPHYYSHESLHDSLTVPRHGIRNVTIGDTYSYK